MVDSNPKRKPSVAVSRRFSCARAYNLNETKESSKGGNRPDRMQKKIIWNGTDATPLPLLTLERNIHFKRGIANVANLPENKDTVVSWIEHILKENYSIG